MGVVSLKGSLLLMAFLIHTVLTAPVIEENTALLGPDQIAEGTGCYYNYEHYEEGDRILTNEPCLNCTCHNRMLMCYLRVCPFTKAIGQDCKVEKKPDQCCPVITCPQVPVALLTSSTTETTASSTAVGHPDNYGCVLDDNVFYADGAQVPSDPRKPCELCYCIRNQTACVMQECTLNVEGCKPVYQEGVCCPVRYDCDYDEVLTTPRPTAGLVTTPGGPNECKANERIFKDGEMIENMTDNPCEHCYCMRGDVVCAVQECGTPLENTECTPMPAEPGQCCPNTYQCPNGTVPAHVLQASTNQKPSPPVAPSLAQIKPEGATETPVPDDKVIEGSDSTGDGQENDNAEEEQQEPEKTNGPADSTVAESNEVVTEAPKQQAIIEIITTSAPQDVAEGQTHASPSEAVQTDVEQLPEAEHEISSVLEIVPEHDQVEEGHEEEEHVQEGHVEDGHDMDSHDVEATTAPGHYTEISVENVEMNTSAPEVAKPDIPSESHTLEVTETPNTEVSQEMNTVGPSSPIKEQPMNGNEEVNNQLVEHDASQPSNQDATSELDNQEVVSQPENLEATTKPEEDQDAVSQPENQEAISQPENQEAVSQPENPIVSQIDNQDSINQPENYEASTQVENQQPTSQPDVQSEVQETTIRPEIQEVINQLDNQEAGSQQDKEEMLQPETQEPNSQQVNQESSSQQEIVSSPTEPAPSSEMPQEPLPQENEKLSPVSDLPETTPAPVSSTTTTEAEPEEMPRIPGEGSCLHKGITYAPNTEVPSANTCKRCRCINSIVQCNDIECPEPPVSLYSNCVPMPPTDDACCPTYFCEQKPSQEPEVDSMSIDKIDEGVEEVAPEEGIAPTTVASVHEDVPAVSENFVPGTHEISELINPSADKGSQPDSQVSEDAEEVKPSGGELLPESVIPSGEESKPESDVPSEGSQPESVILSGEESKPESDVPSEGSQAESVIPSGEVSKPESNVPAEGSQPESVIPPGEESKPESDVPSEGSQSESVIPSGEESKPESDVPAEGSQPESDVPAEGSQPESDVPAEGSQPELDVPAEGSQPESVIPSGEESKPESDVPAEASQPESVIPSAEESKPESDVPAEASQPESVIPSSGESKPESDVPAEGSQPESANLSEVSQPESLAESATEPHVANDITTALPEVPSDHQGFTSLDQKEESPVEVDDDVHPVSLDNAESDSDSEATSTSPSQIISEEQGSKLTEAQGISEVPETTAVDDQQPATERPQHPTEEEASLDGSEDAHPEHPATVEPVSDIYTSTEKLQHQELHESQGSQDVFESEKLEESIQTTVPPVHEESTHMENEHEPLPQHGDMTNEEAHDGQESVTEDGSSALGVPSTDTPSISMDEHEGAEHDSEPSGSSQPIEAEAVPTIDQAENDLTAAHDQSTPESPTTAIPDETSSIHAEYNEAQLLSTEGPSGASELPEVHEPMVTSGPPVLFPDIGHQGAPIHIPGPTGINTDGITSEDERLGETEAPSQELSQTENPQAPEESSSSGNVQQASEVSEGGVKDDTVYTTEGLSSVPSQTEEVANEIVPGGGSDADSEHNQITESSQTNEPGAAHDDANEISPPEHKPAESGDNQSHVEEVEAPEKVEPTEVSQSATETPDEHVPHHDETEVHPTHDETEVQPTHDETEVQPTHDETEIPTIHDESEGQPIHDDTVTQSTHDESEAEQTHVESEAQPTHDESEAQPTHDESVAQQIHDDSEAQQSHEETHNEEEAHAAHGETEAPSISEKDVTEEEVIPTEAPLVPIVTHGDLPTPSEPIAENVVPSVSETEVEKQPETTETQQSQDEEVSASQPAVESQVHEEVELASEHPQEVTQAPENDEVVTHIDSAGPQQVPEIANQVVETDTNAIEHATGSDHEEEPTVPIEDGKTGADEVANAGGDHQEPNGQEQTSQPEQAPITPEEHHSDSVDENQEHLDVAPVEHHKQPDVAPVEQQERPESDQIHPESESAIEDHSEGHSGPLLSGAHTLEETQKQQTEQPISEIPSEETQPAQQQPETEAPESLATTGETQSEPSGPQEETVQALPEVTHDENQPEQPAIEEHVEQVEPHHEETHEDHSDPHSEVIEEQPHTTPISEPQEPSQDTEVQPEHQNVFSGQQVAEEEEKPAVSEHQESHEVAGDGQETATPQESGSGQPITDGPVAMIEETSEHVPLVPNENGPAPTGEEHAQTAAPVEEETGETDDVTAVPEHSGNVAGDHQPLAEEEKDVGLTTETTPAVQHGDLLEGTHEQPDTPEGQPNETIVLSPDVPESEPSGSDSPTPTPEEVPIESAPSAPSAPESAPSAPGSVAQEEPSAPEAIVPEQPLAPESVVPDQPSAPESVVPEQPSAPESVLPEQPSAPESVLPEQPSAPELVVPEQPEYTAPEQPSAPESEVQPLVPEQPVAPETKPSSVGEDEVTIPQESDSSSQPDQSSHIVEEIEKEQPIPETSSSPISELPQSSPLPPVEIPSTEGPVLPPGLQTWSQKPYHPPSLPEHQQHHHTTAEVPHLPEDSHYPSQPYDQDYEDDDNVSYGPGTCRYGGKVYLSAQQIPRDDPCDFCFCFRSDIICLQQSCPPPIRGCYQETIKGFCCPRYECHVSMATMVNITTTSTTTTTTVPPHFLSHHYNGSAMKAGCQVKGIAYRVGDRIPSTSGPCLDCRCGADGQMKCDPTVCGPQESLLRQVMAASVSKRRRR